MLTLVMLSCVALGSLLAAVAGVRELVIAALLVAVLDLVLMHAGGSGSPPPPCSTRTWGAYPTSPSRCWGA